MSTTTTNANNVTDVADAASATGATSTTSAANVTVTFVLNDQQTTYTGDANARLLDILRDELGRVDVKCGCREGECGACSVLLNDTVVNSCTVALGRVDGAKVTTLVGLVGSKRFEVLDKCFAARSAVQCGYCIPGMIMAAEGLLRHNPHPSEAEVRVAISGNLCRCTGYNAIVQAILDAAKEGDGLW